MFSRLVYVFIFIVFIALPFTLYPLPLYAFTMENQNIRIELPDVFGDRIFEGSPNAPKTPQSQPKEPPKPLIIQGFPNQTSSKSLPAGRQAFSLTIPTLLIDFGIITPTDPVTRTVHTIIRPGNAFTGYALLAQENHALKTTSGDEISDTLCDSGICGESIAGPWNNPLVFGLGLRVDNIQGQGTSVIFKEPSDYAQIANTDAFKSAFPLMQQSFSQEKRNNESRITLKVNVSATQKEGVYQNVISLIAIPSL